MTDQENQFDTVHDCQKVFRELLRAISNPGVMADVAEYAQKTEMENGAFVAIANTLLDVKNSFYILGTGMRKENLVGLTRSVYTHSAPKFIFAVSECSSGEIDKCFEIASPGSIVEPHKNSVLFVSVPFFDDECRLSGPGIDGMRNALLSRYALSWLEKRDRMEYEYPSGIDIFFVTSAGKVVAVPRKVRVEG